MDIEFIRLEICSNITPTLFQWLITNQKSSNTQSLTHTLSLCPLKLTHSHSLTHSFINQICGPNMGSLLNPNFLLPHLNLLFVRLSHPLSPEQPDPKRRREPKGKEIIEIRRTRPSSEEEGHRPTKQQRISHALSREPERGEVQLPEPQAWLPAPMLGGESLTDDASIRDYNGGIGCHVASVLEETLLLPKDMVEL